MGERVFAMDLATWTTEDLGPVILMSDDMHDHIDDDDDDDYRNDIYNHQFDQPELCILAKA